MEAGWDSGGTHREGKPERRLNLGVAAEEFHSRTGPQKRAAHRMGGLQHKTLEEISRECGCIGMKFTWVEHLNPDEAIAFPEEAELLRKDGGLSPSK